MLKKIQALGESFKTGNKVLVIGGVIVRIFLNLLVVV